MARQPKTAQASSTRFNDHTQAQHTRLGISGRTIMRGRDLYPTIHNTHMKQISKIPAEFEPAIPASERPQTHALDSTPTGIANFIFPVFFHLFSFLPLYQFILRCLKMLIVPLTTDTGSPPQNAGVLTNTFVIVSSTVI